MGEALGKAQLESCRKEQLTYFWSDSRSETLENHAPLAPKFALSPRKDTFPGLSLLVAWNSKQLCLGLGSYIPHPKDRAWPQPASLASIWSPFPTTALSKWAQTPGGSSSLCLYF